MSVEITTDDLRALAIRLDLLKWETSLPGESRVACRMVSDELQDLADEIEARA